ncbi:MOSC domain-containing protein [Niallia endozanthoxylica]|uniref:MOSC domain-containing protein n=1 Tax=Niallia endozanthoxylica TaxID=2036016 RepID=A0A5J5HIA3_9BACI|nr:MOSC domain-containing protein [Niallia endozanthoxylica]KAA9019483.1 MOSC domain-containing protein [Niallia endozanthoxylica]
MQKPYIEKLFAGKVKKLGSLHAATLMEREWETGMFKERMIGEIWLEKTGLIGDEVADTKNHGGVEKALFAYPIKHYDDWRKEPKLETIEVGAMGENLAVSQMEESSVCVGDTYQFGDAVIQVSQPRQPCWKPARRFRLIDFAIQIQQSGRTGWYFRVLKEAFVHDKQELVLLDRPYPQWTISKCNEVMHMKKDDIRLAKKLASCELLALNWKQTLQKRATGEISPVDKRVFGPNKVSF